KRHGNGGHQQELLHCSSFLNRGAPPVTAGGVCLIVPHLSVATTAGTTGTRAVAGCAITGAGARAGPRSSAVLTTGARGSTAVAGRARLPRTITSIGPLLADVFVVAAAIKRRRRDDRPLARFSLGRRHGCMRRGRPHAVATTVATRTGCRLRVNGGCAYQGAGTQSYCKKFLHGYLR